MTETRLELRLASELSQIAVLGEALERFGVENGLSRRIVFETCLALEELVTNIILHGYGHNEGGIEIVLELQGEELHIEIRDEGVGFDPCAAPSPDVGCSLEDRYIGGLGIHLARNLVDTMRYERAEGRNVLELRKHVGPRRPAPDEENKESGL